MKRVEESGFWCLVVPLEVYWVDSWLLVLFDWYSEAEERVWLVSFGQEWILVCFAQGKILLWERLWWLEILWVILLVGLEEIWWEFFLLVVVVKFQHIETFVGKLGTQIRVSPSKYHMVVTLNY